MTDYLQYTDREMEVSDNSKPHKPIRIYTSDGWRTVPRQKPDEEKPRWLTWQDKPRRVGHWSGKGRC